ncbi:MAG: hypothetical protein JO356_19305 [Acidobacteria bacterium]|nr:hypothetical protein [Acidobacteriota bacterium]
MGQSAGAVDICLPMASQVSRGLIQGGRLESGECQATLNEGLASGSVQAKDGRQTS